MSDAVQVLLNRREYKVVWLATTDRMIMTNINILLMTTSWLLLMLTLDYRLPHQKYHRQIASEPHHTYVGSLLPERSQLICWTPAFAHGQHNPG